MSNTAAVAVFDSRQTWGEPDRGIQLFGSAVEAHGRAGERAEAIYTARFPRVHQLDLGAYQFFLFRARRLKLFDEHALGTGVFVTAKVAPGGRLTWECTEIYRSGKHS